MNNTMPENKKATAPIPAVAAAGEQSIINETTNIIRLIVKSSWTLE